MPVEGALRDVMQRGSADPVPLVVGREQIALLVERQSVWLAKAAGNRYEVALGRDLDRAAAIRHGGIVTHAVYLSFLGLLRHPAASRELAAYRRSRIRAA